VRVEHLHVRTHLLQFEEVAEPSFVETFEDAGDAVGLRKRDAHRGLKIGGNPGWIFVRMCIACGEEASPSTVSVFFCTSNDHWNPPRRSVSRNATR